MPSVLAHPQRVGPYDIIQLLGEGGMGVVYEAEETEPVRRRVALKLVRAGLDTRDVLARFDAERRALAVMNHAGIAKVLHAGSTEQGQPYFAMELVRGSSITSFCDLRRLSIRERISLFIGVCEAVQHAHQKGVIHRDLKPSNVLVADEDGRYQPKVIDFGIAKALGPVASDFASVTMGGIAVGTAAYMSPEQADTDTGAVDVDTRSDIYSLGVVLYELLVGHLPLDPAAMGLHPFLARLIAGDANPPTPSMGLLTRPVEQREVAKLRRTELRELQRELKGDLDWIVMKAMHPDRTHRYETANALAADLRRHLADEPVVARPPSARYRLSKFVKRHRFGVLAISAIATALLVGGVASAVGFVHATRAEKRAAQEAEAAQSVTTFLVDLFRVSDPGESRGNTLTAREILARGTRRVASELAGQPELQARIMQTMGTVHSSLGQYAETRTLLGEVLRIRERTLGPDNMLVGETLAALGEVARRRGDYDEADRLLTRALTIRQSLGPMHPSTASVINNLGEVQWKLRRYAVADTLFRQALEVKERTLAAGNPSIAVTLNGLAGLRADEGRYAESEPLYQRALQIREKAFGATHPEVGATLKDYASMLRRAGRSGEASLLEARAATIH